MIKVDVKFKRKKLTLEQKALKVAVTKVSKETKEAIRKEMPYVTGALYYSITNKVKSDKESNAYAVIGAKSRYSKSVQGVEKVPNKYLGKVEAIHNVMHNHTGDEMLNKIKEEVTVAVQNMKAKDA